MFLLILDSVGNSELLLILGAALIFFGPRRLPQLSRQIGKSLTEFRRASEDFKRTWEREVNLEHLDQGPDQPAENSILDKATERLRAAREAAALDSNPAETAASVIAPSSLDKHLQRLRHKGYPCVGQSIWIKSGRFHELKRRVAMLLWEILISNERWIP